VGKREELSATITRYPEALGTVDHLNTGVGLVPPTGWMIVGAARGLREPPQLLGAVAWSVFESVVPVAFFARMKYE
jgi:hypothetical protein